MELALLDLFETEEAINQEDCYVEGFWHQAEFAVHVDDPFDKEGSGSVFDFVWELGFLKVVRLNHELLLLFSHGGINIGRKLRNHLRVAQVELIGEGHSLANCLPISDQSFFKEIRNTFVSPVFLGPFYRLFFVKIVTSGLMTASGTVGIIFMKLDFLTLEKASIILAVRNLLNLIDGFKWACSLARNKRLNV